MIPQHFCAIPIYILCHFSTILCGACYMVLVDTRLHASELVTLYMDTCKKSLSVVVAVWERRKNECILQWHCMGIYLDFPMLFSYWYIKYVLSQPTIAFTILHTICLRAAGGQLEGDKGEKTKAREISWEAKGADGETTTSFIWHGWSSQSLRGHRETMSNIIE